MSQDFGEFLQPIPLDPQHEGRAVRQSPDAPVEFEEVLKNPRGEESRPFRTKDDLRNLRWVYAIGLVLLGVLLVRSAGLQIAEADRYRGLAEGNRLREIVEPAPRGILYDRNKVQLVKNVPSYELDIIPVDVPADEQERTALFERTAQTFSIKVRDLEDAYEEADPLSLDPVTVEREISRDQALMLEARAGEFVGVQAQVRAIREYSDPESLSHVLGYVGKLTKEEYDAVEGYELNDEIGKAGVEQSHEDTLRGEHGARNVEVNALGEVVNVLATKPPVAGDDLMLGIDDGLQKVLYDSLTKAAERSGKKRAAAVAVDPRNGEILALVSVPGFNLNDFAKGVDPEKLAALLEDPNQPLFTRPLSGTYSPGSTFKPFVATGALQEGTITENTFYTDTGSIEVGGQTFRSWKPGGQGSVNVIGAIAHSVNTFFYSIGGGFGDIDGIGIAGIDKIAQAFGFGQQLGVDLPGEAKGLLPTPDWKEANYGEPWYLGDTYNASIGQGFVLVTPLQLANATAAVANGGTVWWPHVAKQIIHSDGTVEEVTPRALTEKVADADAVDTVRRGMRATVEGGTGQLLASLSVPAAAKTGTAQFGGGDPNAWFTSFAPYDEPTIALAIIVEQAGEGSDFAAPVALDALRYYFGKKDVQSKE